MQFYQFELKRYLCTVFKFHTHMITVTEKAKKRIHDLRSESNYNDDFFLRVGVESGGCSGLSYKLDFDNQVKDGDEVIDFDGVRVVTDKRSVLYLFGTELDFTDGLNGKGFTFNNPNASRTCSCGESFAV
jgi:iron-sulfur cluster assembly protein